MNCPMCNGEYEGFRDQESIDEYRISGLCQKCQDKNFGVSSKPPANGHCPNCGKYFYLEDANKFGGVCSQTCFNEFKAYLMGEE